MIVKELMSKDVISLSPDDSLSELISLVEKHQFREIPVIEKKKLKGIIFSKDVAEKGVQNPSKVKVSTVMRHNITKISSEEDAMNAARLMFKTGLRAIPVVEKDKVVGIVSMHDIIKIASKTKQFKQTKAEQVMSVPEIITNDTDIGKARYMMRNKNISRLPVIDESKKLSAVVTIFDLLKAVKPKERMNFYSMAAEKEVLMNIPVSTIMNKRPVTVSKSDSLNDIVNVIDKEMIDGVVVIDNNYPVGVITEKDLLEVYVSSLEKKGVFYQISGLKDEDDFIVATVDRMIRDSLKKLSKMYEIQFFFLHVKRHDKKGKVKYSIRTRIMTNKGLFISKSYAWDLRSAVDEALDRLERAVIGEKVYRKERARKMSNYKKLLR